MVDERTLRVHQVELVVNARPQKRTISSAVLFLYLREYLDVLILLPPKRSRLEIHGRRSRENHMPKSRFPIFCRRVAQTPNLNLNYYTSEGSHV